MATGGVFNFPTESVNGLIGDTDAMATSNYRIRVDPVTWKRSDRGIAIDPTPENLAKMLRAERDQRYEKLFHDAYMQLLDGMVGQTSTDLDNYLYHFETYQGDEGSGSGEGVNSYSPLGTEPVFVRIARIAHDIAIQGCQYIEAAVLSKVSEEF